MKHFWIIDGHCDSIGDYASGKRRLRNDRAGHWDIFRARQGGIGLQFLASYIESEYKPYLADRRGLELLAASRRFVAENEDLVFLIETKGDLYNLLTEDRLGILFSVEGGEILGESLFMLEIIHALGARSLGLTWNERNAIGDGVGEEGSKSRLSLFGVQVVKRMNDLGMLVDVSHLSEAGFWHVLEVTDKPVAATHSCAYALCAHPRNLKDEQLKALAWQGGVIGINFYPEFLSSSGQAGIKEIVDHICHVAMVAGPEVVGLGSDFDGIDYVPQGLESAEHYGALVEALMRRGFQSKELEGICRGNFLRLLQNVL